MKPRYVVVNKSMRKEFEEEWQLPYGYANCPIFMSYNEALEELECILEDCGDAIELINVQHDYVDDFIIEKCENGHVEVVYER